MDAGNAAEAVPDELPAAAMQYAGPVSVWAVEALDRFVCWMTYARLFEHVDLLGAWIDSAEQFSLVLWDRRAGRALGRSVSASEWADPVRQTPVSIVADLVARTQAASPGHADPVGISWDRDSGIRRLPWQTPPLSDVAPAESSSMRERTGAGGAIEVGQAAFDEAVRELRDRYRGATWAGTMLWRMIDGFRVGWAANLRLLAGWMSTSDELIIILHDTTTEHEEPHRGELARLLLPGQHSPRVGARVWQLDDAPGWRNDHIDSVSDDLAELTATTPTSGLAREVAQGFARVDGGTIWLRTRSTDPSPQNPWADLHRRVLDS